VLLDYGQTDLALFAALLAASSLGFLFLNRPPALVFMGDVGSTFLGFSFAVLPLLAFNRVGDPRALVVGALLVAPFVLDGAYTILRRAYRHENVLTAHRTHVYQRLVKQGYSHWQITGLYALYALASACCGLLYETSGSLPVVIIPILIFAGLVLWTRRREHGAKSPFLRISQHLKRSPASD
jgi:UDP-N-acetylmuramyl pentapeptide phosphotransferase/UDP-N-acetylglucosamine-1-phosphate transferase